MALLVVLRLGEGDMAITHLQFVNNMILFSSSNMEEIVLFIRILKSFEFSSGLRINLSKSRMVGVGCLKRLLGPQLHILVARSASFIFHIWVCQLGPTPKSIAVWNPIIEKFEHELLAWNRSYLSLGGRIALIKASLSSFPAYFMSPPLMPSVVREKLDHIRRTFVWDGQCDKKKIASHEVGKYYQTTSGGRTRN